MQIYIDRARLTFTADVDLKIPIILDMVYPQKWIDEPAEDDAQGRSNREIQIEVSPSPYLGPPYLVAPDLSAQVLSHCTSALPRIDLPNVCWAHSPCYPAGTRFIFIL